MIKNYFKIALRTLARNKTFSLINIIGLAIGTLCCLYIVLYVQDQYHYDKHHDQAKDIYRVTTVIKSRGDENHMATTSPPIAPAMKHDFPEISQYTRVIPTLGIDQNQLSYKNKSFYEKDAKLVDSTFFEVFTYHFVYGNPANALTQPTSIVLLRTISDKLFAGEDPMGKTIEINNAWGKREYTVAGVVDNSLGKTQIQANFFISLNGYQDFDQDQEWGGHNFANSYVKLQPGADPIALEKKFPAFMNKYAAKVLKNRGMEKQLQLQPVGSVHTSPGYAAESGKTVSPSFLFLMLMIAGLIQVIACINFMNLSTARASNRAKEVGIRKVIGAGRKSLVFQFLGESFLMSLLSVMIAILLLIITLPFLNQITQADITISFAEGGRLWILAAGIVLVTGFFLSFSLSGNKSHERELYKPYFCYRHPTYPRGIPVCYVRSVYFSDHGYLCSTGLHKK
jgi:putative ABC transport system permease protein